MTKTSPEPTSPSSSNSQPKMTPISDILAYATGDGANSLIMNGIFGFLMIYYTDALGLEYKLAGWAMAVATFWDAITDPVMGHVTDNTRSRFGRRHPYMLLGGFFSVICFFFVWFVPEACQSPRILFWYLVVINLLLRTGITVYLISYGALGFEICTDYNQRTTLQGVKVGFNMLVNLLGPALAWTLFFPTHADGSDGTKIASNYVHMGAAFALASLGFVLFVTFATRRYAVDTRGRPPVAGGGLGGLLRDLLDILFDPYPRSVFVFIAIVNIGMVLVSSLQIYVYVHFMQFSAVEKTFVHGSTMVGCGLGGVISAWFVRRLDKKPTVLLAVIATVLANVTLILLFVTGWMPRGLGWKMPLGYVLPISTLVFLLFHAAYWMGNGIFSTVAGSMMADVSEICRYRTGVLKDGGYSAMLSFIAKTSFSVGLLLTGYCLDWVGFDPKAEVQSASATQYLAATTFLAGAAIALIAMVAMFRCPVTRTFMLEVKRALAVRDAAGGEECPTEHGNDS